MPPFTNDTIISYFFLHSRTVESVDFSSTDRRVKKILIVVASVNSKLFLQDLFITGLPHDTSAEQKQQSVFFLNDKKPGAETPGNQAQLPVLGNRITLLAGLCIWFFLATVNPVQREISSEKFPREPLIFPEMSLLVWHFSAISGSTRQRPFGTLILHHASREGGNPLRCKRTCA